MARILVVDDDPLVLLLTARILREEGYHVMPLTEPARTLRALSSFAPDMILLDVSLGGPEGDGLALLEEIRRRGFAGPVFMLTGRDDPETQRRCAEAGADDFLLKPLDGGELRSRVRMALEAGPFFRWRREPTAQPSPVPPDIEEDLMFRLSRVTAFRHGETFEHTRRVGRLAGRLSGELGLSGEFSRCLEEAAPFHDLGKVGIPDSILLKPGPLTTEERRTMETHARLGWEVLRDSPSPLMRMASRVALTHHERWDGGGYPQGLKGEAIPLEGRLTCVADAFDAMISDRPYRLGMEPQRAAAELLRGRGTQFDPGAVDVFLKLAEAGKHLVPVPIETSPPADPGGPSRAIPSLDLAEDHCPVG